MRRNPPNGIMLIVPALGEMQDGREEAPVSVEEENIALVRRFLEAGAVANLGVMDELLAPDFVDTACFPDRGPAARTTCRESPKTGPASPTSASS